MFKNLLIVSSLLAFSLNAAAQNKSVCTDLVADKCKTVDADKGMPGNYSGKCIGQM